MVDVEFVEKFRELVPLQQLKADRALAGMLVVQRGQRLSVQPVERDALRAHPRARVGQDAAALISRSVDRRLGRELACMLDPALALDAARQRADLARDLSALLGRPCGDLTEARHAQRVQRALETGTDPADALEIVGALAACATPSSSC